MCWGLSGSMGQFLFQTQGMDTRWLVPIRLGCAGIILLIYSFIKYSPARTIAPWKDPKERLDLIIYGLLGVSCCQFLYFLTIQLSSAAMGTILQDLSPIMILLVGCLAAKRLPRAYEIVAIVLALGGVFLLTTHGNMAQMSISAAALIAGTASAICVTIYNVVPVRLMDKYPIFILQSWAFLMGSVAFLLIFRPWTYGYVPSPIGLFGIAFVVLVGNVMAFPLYMQGVKYIGPEKGILYGFSEPVTAAVIGVLFLGNKFTAWDLSGFIAIFAMLMLISFGDKKHKNNSVQ